MKQRITTYVFTPSARTVDLSGVPGFNFSGLLAIINGGQLLYAVATPTLAATCAAGVVTLNSSVNLAGMLSTDGLTIFYDDGVAAASDANLTSIAGAPGSAPPAQATGASGLFGWLRTIVDTLAAFPLVAILAVLQSNAPVSAPTLVAPDDAITFTPGSKGTVFIVTVAGYVKAGFANGITWTEFYGVGKYQEPYLFNQVFLTGTTAVLTVYTV